MIDKHIFKIILVPILVFIVLFTSLIFYLYYFPLTGKTLNKIPHWLGGGEYGFLMNTFGETRIEYYDNGVLKSQTVYKVVHGTHVIHRKVTQTPDGFIKAYVTNETGAEISVYENQNNYSFRNIDFTKNGQDVGRISFNKKFVPIYEKYGRNQIKRYDSGNLKSEETAIGNTVLNGKYYSPTNSKIYSYENGNGYIANWDTDKNLLILNKYDNKKLLNTILFYYAPEMPLEYIEDDENGITIIEKFDDNDKPIFSGKTFIPYDKKGLFGNITFRSKNLDSIKNVLKKATIRKLEYVKYALEGYKKLNGRYPEKISDILPEKQSIVYRFYSNEVNNIIFDTWKNPFFYKIMNDGANCSFGSWGADGKEGGSGHDEDIVFNI